MNLVLFEPHELAAPLPVADRRVQHVLRVLRRGAGESFDAGLVNGPRGKATLTAIANDCVKFTFAPTAPATTPPTTLLIVGLPRPQTARDILRDATTIGVAAMHFVATDKGEPSYAQSTLWSTDEWRRHVLTGAEQAFDTHVPDVTHGRKLSEVLTTLPPRGRRLALDNYESSLPLAKLATPIEQPVVLAVGSERGWSAAERDRLREAGFTLAHLGPRVLRTETAVIAALASIGAHVHE